MGLLARKKREEEGEQSLLNKTFSFRQASASSSSWQIVSPRCPNIYLFVYLFVMTSCSAKAMAL